jgi:hypothetical protein
MNCPHCASPTTKEQTRKTLLGSRTFCCSGCRRTCNERTGGNPVQLPRISHRYHASGRLLAVPIYIEPA